jgi:predicted HTH transcriptional regulator
MNHQESSNEELDQLIFAGESDRVEFKSTLRYDLRTKEVNKKLEFVIAKTIAAFLNSEGGDLLIGIDDDSNALGLADDLKTLGKKNIDGFELKLIEIIKSSIGLEVGGHIKISFPVYDGQKICRIHVSESGVPVFIKHEGQEDFFVRTGCSSQPLSREKQSRYEKEHW